MQYFGRSLKITWLAATWLAIAGMLPAVAFATDAPHEGRVLFYNIADSDFDRYSENPSMQTSMDAKPVPPDADVHELFRPGRMVSNAWFYKDSYAVKPSWEIFTTHRDWILHDEDGNLLYIPWGCDDGGCPQFAGDFGNPEFRRHWIDEAREHFATGYAGIWIDDVNLDWRVGDGNGEFRVPLDPRTGKAMLIDDWRRYFAEFMEEIRAAFPDREIAHNAIWYAAPLDNPQLRRQIAAADYINLERGATDSGLTGGSGRFGFSTFLEYVDFVHASGRAVILMDYGTTARRQKFGLAAWFLMSIGTDMIASNQIDWTAPGKFWRGYSLDLGRALTKRYESGGLLRRDFECGMVLLNPPGSATRHFEPPTETRYSDGRKAGVVSLRERSAAILEHECLP